MTISGSKFKAALAAACIIVSASAGAQDGRHFKFDFGHGRVAEGYVGVTPEDRYNPGIGYGFEGNAALASVERRTGDALTSDFVTTDGQHFKFSVKLPQGNYKVTVTLGDTEGTSMTTVKAEERRLMLERLTTAKNEVVTRSFGVNTRDNTLSPGNAIPSAASLNLTIFPSGPTRIRNAPSIFAAYVLKISSPVKL